MIGRAKARVLDGVIAALRYISDATVCDFARYAGVCKSVVHHYTDDKRRAIRLAYERYLASSRDPLDIRVSLSIWQAARDDLELAALLRADRKAERKALEAILGNPDGAMLYQAAAVGIGAMRVLGESVDADAALGLLRWLLLKAAVIDETSPATSGDQVAS